MKKMKNKQANHKPTDEENFKVRKMPTLGMIR